MNIFSIIKRFLARLLGGGDDVAAGVSPYQEPEEAEIQRHVGQWIEVDHEPVHILAAPNMSDEDFDSIAKMVIAARRMMQERYPNGIHLETGDEPRDDPS